MAIKLVHNSDLEDLVTKPYEKSSDETLALQKAEAERKQRLSKLLAEKEKIKISEKNAKAVTDTLIDDLIKANESTYDEQDFYAQIKESIDNRKELHKAYTEIDKKIKQTVKERLSYEKQGYAWLEFIEEPIPAMFLDLKEPYMKDDEIAVDNDGIYIYDRANGCRYHIDTDACAEYEYDLRDPTLMTDKRSDIAIIIKPCENGDVELSAVYVPLHFDYYNSKAIKEEITQRVASKEDETTMVIFFTKTKEYNKCEREYFINYDYETTPNPDGAHDDGKHRYYGDIVISEFDKYNVGLNGDTLQIDIARGRLFSDAIETDNSEYHSSNGHRIREATYGGIVLYEDIKNTKEFGMSEFKPLEEEKAYFVIESDGDHYALQVKQGMIDTVKVKEENGWKEITKRELYRAVPKLALEYSIYLKENEETFNMSLDHINDRYGDNVSEVAFEIYLSAKDEFLSNIFKEEEQDGRDDI